MIDGRIQYEAIRSDNPMDYAFGNGSANKAAEPIQKADEQVQKKDFKNEKNQEKKDVKPIELTAGQQLKWIGMRLRLIALGTAPSKIESIKADFAAGKPMSF